MSTPTGTAIEWPAPEPNRISALALRITRWRKRNKVALYEPGDAGHAAVLAEVWEWPEVVAVRALAQTLETQAGNDDQAPSFLEYFDGTFDLAWGSMRAKFTETGELLAVDAS